MNSVKNANSQSHEWLREINHLLPFRSNGETRHGQIRFLKGTEVGHQRGGPMRWGQRDLWPEAASDDGEVPLWSGFSAWGVTLRSQRSGQSLMRGHGCWSCNSCPSQVRVNAQSLQSCPTLCDPTGCSSPGSSVQGFSRQEYWSGLPCPFPGDLPDPGIELVSPAL